MKLRKKGVKRKKQTNQIIRTDHHLHSRTTLSHLIDPVTGEERHGKSKKLFFKKQWQKLPNLNKAINISKKLKKKKNKETNPKAQET